ncbi:hypothetical protein [Nostoc sp.]|uniref:hypothetical protein n=1 Tax=Nostoc sp. TaxID=1180 RepID=UPI002FF61283
MFASSHVVEFVSEVAVFLIGAEMEQEFEQTKVAKDGDVVAKPLLLCRLGC